MPLLDASLRHPLTLPDGTLHTNTVYLNQVIDHPNIEVGDFSYYNDFDAVDDHAARIAPYLYPGAPERLVIGKFCQFAHGTRFITSSADHPKRWFTTYPFAVFNHAAMPLFEAEFARGRDTLVGNEVWIGHGAMILPGTTIGNGVIVGAGAVVGGNIPPYTVVAGNPAKPVRRRFDDTAIAFLEELRWWDLPIEKIEELLPSLASNDFEGLKAVARRQGV